MAKDKKAMTLKEARNAHIKDFKFLVDHGSYTKGDVVPMHLSTGNALSKHKVVEIVK